MDEHRSQRPVRELPSRHGILEPGEVLGHPSIENAVVTVAAAELALSKPDLGRREKSDRDGPGDDEADQRGGVALGESREPLEGAGAGPPGEQDEGGPGREHKDELQREDERDPFGERSVVRGQDPTEMAGGSRGAGEQECPGDHPDIVT